VDKVSRKGLSTFLAHHEECGGGFEVQRRQGSAGSIVRVVCGGCGKTIEYPAASDEELSMELPVSRSSSQRLTKRNPRMAAAGAGKPEAPKPGPESGRRAGTSAPQADKGPPRRRESGARSIGWRSWLPGLIAGLIGGALVLIVLAIASGGGSSDGRSTSTVGSASRETPTAPTSTAPTASAPAPAAKRPSRPSRHEVRLERRQLADRVSIGVPRGWSAGISGGAVTVVAGNGNAEVQVYYEPGVKPDPQLAEASKAFLLQRHPSGRVASVGPIDAGGVKARRVEVKYDTGTESAVVLVADGYSYLILERLGKPSSPEMRRTTAAVAMSFRPV
jgi:hypothetical protein